jgi:hypothetical protein
MLGTWNVSILHNRSLSVITPARELEIYKLDFVCVQDLGGGRQYRHGKSRGLYSCIGNERNHQLGTERFVYHGTISAVNRVDLVSDVRIDVRGRWFNIFVLDVHAPSEKKIDDSRYR